MKTLLFAIFMIPVFASAQTVTTVAGNGIPSYSGDGGLAPASGLSGACQVIADATGNIYIADYLNHVIRKIDVSGIISTFAGTGMGGYSGDGGPATAANLNKPTGICLDAAGSLVVADMGNDVVRKIDGSGIITTIAGTGGRGHTGDGGPALSATFYLTQAVCVSPSGDIYIADAGNCCIRKINSAGIISNVAGTGSLGFSGDGGPANLARLANPFGITFDASGNLYIADQNNDRIRMVNTSGTIKTIAGTSRGYSGDGGPATVARFNTPAAVFVNAADTCIYIADQLNGAIRKINSSGIISAVAGTGAMGYGGDGGAPLLARFYSPSGLCIDGTGNMYIADQLNHRLRKISTCAASVSLQPKDNTIAVAASTKFVVATTVPAPMYKWQQDLGTGFTDLTNVWPYSGVNTDTLTLSSVGYSLHGTRYRCEVSSENVSCGDISWPATLKVLLPAQVNPLSVEVSVFPNPAETTLSVQLSEFISAGQLQIINGTGQVVASQNINSSSNTIDVSALPGGVYMLKITLEHEVVYNKVYKN